MKKLNYLSIVLCIVLFSCNSLESKVEDYAKKECECKSLKGAEKKSCKEELKELEAEIKEEMKDLKPSEEEELEKIYKDAKFEACK